MTGDLAIIQNAELRKLLQKGLNYRDMCKPDKNVSYSAYTSAIDLYINKISTKLSLPCIMFSSWKSLLLKHIKSELDDLTPYKYNRILGKKVVRDELDKLKQHFIFCPVDKASNNVSLICKRFYHDTLDHELTKSGNFVTIDEDENTTVKDILDYMKKNKMSIPPKNHKLPFLYWTPKKHKSPVGSRFITSSTITTNSTLSMSVGIALKTLLKSDKYHSKFHCKFKSYKNYFIVDNRDDVIEYMKTHNGSNNKYRKSVHSYDFSNLYTSIPHTKLIDCISKFVNKVFKSKNDQTFITVNKSTAYFAKSRTKSSSAISYSAKELIQHISFIINNSFVVYKGKVFRQIIGIPMGTNCAPHLANIFLHIFECEFIERAIKDGNVELAEEFNGLFRYQDDCIIFDDHDAFENNISNIYPHDMTLKCTNTSRDTCNYLDLTISIYQGDFNYKSYDKRKEFNFEVVNYPDLSGNIPIKQAYGVFVSQLTRFCQINKTSKYFLNDITLLVNKLSKQNFDIHILKDKYLEFSKHKINMWSKFGVDIASNIFMKKIFRLK